MVTSPVPIVMTGCGGSGSGALSSGGSQSATVSVNTGSDDHHQAVALDDGTTYDWRVVATNTSDP